MAYQNSKDALPGDSIQYAATGYWTPEALARQGCPRSHKFVVIHHTAGSKPGDLAQLTGPASVHKYVTKAGERFHLLDDIWGAYGCGTNPEHKTYRLGSPCSINENSCTLQIELENLGNGRDPFTEKQYQIAAEWTAHWCKRYGIPATRDFIVAHYEIATNKNDPAKNFDWNKFIALVQSKLQPPANRSQTFDVPGYGTFVVADPFLKYWENNGALEMFGLPLTPEKVATPETMGYQGTYQVFERSRFEWHDSISDILLGRLGAELLAKGK